MNNISIKRIVALFLFGLSSLLASLMPSKAHLNVDFGYCFIGNETINEESFLRRFPADGRGELMSCAYQQRINSEERLPVVDNAEVARKIAVVLLCANFLPRVDCKNLKTELIDENIWKVYLSPNRQQASPAIYIQREDAKILRIVAKESINQRCSFSPEKRWLYYSDSTVARKEPLVDTPELAYKIGSTLIASSYGQDELRQKPFIVSSINGEVWLVHGNTNASTGIGNVGYVYIYKKNGMVLGMYHTK